MEIIEIDEIDELNEADAKKAKRKSKKQQKEIGPGDINYFSSIDLKCFNAVMEEKNFRTNAMSSFKEEDWQALNDFIFGKSDYNPFYPDEVKVEEEV